MAFHISRFILFTIFLYCPNADAAVSKDPDIFVRVSAVTDITFFETTFLPANCVNLQSRDYYAQSSGKIDYVIASSKIAVEEKEYLLGIDQALNEALKNRAEAEFKASKSNYTRNESLFNRKVISSEEFEKVTANYFAAKANLETVLLNYRNQVIKAPFNGKISTINFKIGDNIRQGDYLFTITAGTDKLIKFNIPQSYKITNPSSAVIEIISEGKNYPAEQFTLSSALDKSSGSFPAQAKVIAPNELLHNSIVQIKLDFNLRTNLAIPESAIIKTKEGNMVYVARNNIAEFIKVALGARHDGLIEVLTGDLKTGDKIITEGLTKLSPGAAIKIID